MITPYRAILLLLALTAGCSQDPQTSGVSPRSSPVPVQVVTVSLTEIAQVHRVTGTVRARDTAAVAAKMMGQIRAVHVRAGDRVRAGQVLVEIDDDGLQASLRRAEAGRLEAQNAVAETENAIAAARTNLELTGVTHRRMQDLLAKTSVSQQEFDESAARLKSAEAALEMALAKQQQARARVEQAEAEIHSAKVVLGYATLAAPFAGLVTERQADPGSLATPGAPILLLEQQGALRLETPVDESRIGLIRPGQVVEVTFDSLGRVVEGRVAEVTPLADPATRSVTVKLALPAIPGLRSGMFGRAAFPAGYRTALLVPEAAVRERGQIQSVYVADGSVARLRLVSLGAVEGRRREVLSGLNDGDRVIVSPPAGLADGAAIEIEEDTP
jgi:multidrug efflux pump subunit AcrA (membrane-fusion protein)